MKREKVKIFIEVCHPLAKPPAYANPTDSGADIFMVEDVEWEPRETKIVRTGIKVAVPEGWELQIRPRSGLSLKTPLRLANSPGTIDAGYRNEVGVIVQNTSSKPFKMNEGERIAQFVISKAPMIEWELVDAIAEYKGDRGGGFGSTGK
jgi:dUTP pyrophosphatase